MKNSCPRCGKLTELPHPDAFETACYDCDRQLFVPDAAVAAVEVHSDHEIDLDEIEVVPDAEGRLDAYVAADRLSVAVAVAVADAVADADGCTKQELLDRASLAVLAALAPSYFTTGSGPDAEAEARLRQKAAVIAHDFAAAWYAERERRTGAPPK